MDTQKKSRVMRFRLTEDEWQTLRIASFFDYHEINEELRKRGLAGVGLDAIANPTEWTRQIVLMTAEQKLKAFGMETPREKREKKEQQERNEKHEQHLKEKLP